MSIKNQQLKIHAMVDWKPAKLKSRAIPHDFVIKSAHINLLYNTVRRYLRSETEVRTSFTLNRHCFQVFRIGSNDEGCSSPHYCVTITTIYVILMVRESVRRRTFAYVRSRARRTSTARARREGRRAFGSVRRCSCAFDAFRHVCNQRA